MFQERATQLNYLNMMKIAQGKSEKPHLAGFVDPVLAKVAQTIAVDEAAHYNFFLEGVRMYLYYYPAAHPGSHQERDRPVLDARRHPDPRLASSSRKRCTTPASTAPATSTATWCRSPSATWASRAARRSKKASSKTREVPDFEGQQLQTTAIWDTFDYGMVEGDVKRLHVKIQEYEKEIGFDGTTPPSLWRTRQCPGKQAGEAADD